jgi:hypothetical protein
MFPIAKPFFIFVAENSYLFIYSGNAFEYNYATKAIDTFYLRLFNL